MAACGSLQRIFEPNNSPLLIETFSSSCKPIPRLKPPSDHFFTGIFDELHFKENPNSKPNSKPSPSPAFPIEGDSTSQANNDGNDNKWTPISLNGYPGSYHKRSESLTSESLQLCTEGLGFESLDDGEDLKIESLDNNSNNNNRKMRERINVREQYSKAKNNGKSFPPPISCIGTTGKPWVCFESHREDGRLLLKEVRIPTQELLHACREDGRLRLCFAQPFDDNDDDDDDDSDGEEEGEGEGEESQDSVREEGEEKRDEEAEIMNDFIRGNS